MLGGKSLANDTSHCGHRLGRLSIVGIVTLHLKLTLCSLSHMVNECRSATRCSAVHIHCNHYTQYSSDTRERLRENDWKSDCCHRRRRRGWCVGQLSNLGPHLHASSWLQQSEPRYWHLIYTHTRSYIILYVSRHSQIGIWKCCEKNEMTHIHWETVQSRATERRQTYERSLCIQISKNMEWLHCTGFVQLLCFLSKNCSLTKQQFKAK